VQPPPRPPPAPPPPPPSHPPARRYRELLLGSVWVLCPGGFSHPETYRLYETLEAGALPILQSHSFWLHLFAHELPPFPLISGARDICKFIQMSDADVEALRMATQAWYRRYKTRVGSSLRHVFEGTPRSPSN
jgi:hypothetical protein